MDKFKLVAEFKPQGDQPQAIKELTEAINKGKRYNTLLGVTGSGKTFTMANYLTHIAIWRMLDPSFKPLRTAML